MMTWRTPGSFLIWSRLARLHLAAIDRALLDDGVEHSGDTGIDAEERLAGDDCVVIDVCLGLSDDVEVLRVLELDGVEAGGGSCGGIGQLAVAEGAAGGGMEDAAREVVHSEAGTAQRVAAAETSICAACGPDAAQGQVIALRGGASASGLSAIDVVEVGLFDAHMAPVGIELLGDHHGEHGLDALADLGGLGHDCDGAVGGDFDEGVRREIGSWCAELRRGDGKIEEAECKASAGECADLEETSPRERLWSESCMGVTPLRLVGCCGGRSCGGMVDSLTDARIGSATADVAVHRSVDLGVGGMGSVGQ